MPGTCRQEFREHSSLRNQYGTTTASACAGKAGEAKRAGRVAARTDATTAGRTTGTANHGADSPQAKNFKKVMYGGRSVTNTASGGIGAAKVAVTAPGQAGDEGPGLGWPHWRRATTNLQGTGSRGNMLTATPPQVHRKKAACQDDDTAVSASFIEADGVMVEIAELRRSSSARAGYGQRDHGSCRRTPTDTRRSRPDTSPGPGAGRPEFPRARQAAQPVRDYDCKGVCAQGRRSQACREGGSKSVCEQGRPRHLGREQQTGCTSLAGSDTPRAPAKWPTAGWRTQWRIWTPAVSRQCIGWMLTSRHCSGGSGTGGGPRA